MKSVPTGRTIGGIEQITYLCEFCDDTKLERVHCSVTAFGSIFKMSCKGDWQVLLRCPRCGLLYSADGHQCDN